MKLWKSGISPQKNSATEERTPAETITFFRPNLSMIVGMPTVEIRFVTKIELAIDAIESSAPQISLKSLTIVPSGRTLISLSRWCLHAESMSQLTYLSIPRLKHSSFVAPPVKTPSPM